MDCGQGYGVEFRCGVLSIEYKGEINGMTSPYL